MSVMYLRTVPRWVLLLVGVLVISEWLSDKTPGGAPAPGTDEESSPTDDPDD